MLRHDSSRSADRNRVLIQGTAAAVNAPDGAGASFRAADNAALRDAAKSEAIKLDLYHLVWIFAVCSVLGLVGETVVSYFVDGRWENRAGFLWGPFSPIYGVGGVLMTLALARLSDARGGVLFGVAAVVGAAFEWFAGWFWENAFGIVAWDYSSQPFNLGGHTCLGIAGSCRCGVGEAGVAGDAARGRYGPQCMACAASLGIAGVFPGGYGCDVRGVRLLDEPLGRRRARRRRAAPLRCALRR